MKKNKQILICLLIVVFLIFLLSFKNTNENIRIRVIANSNTTNDLYTKREVYEIIKSVIKANDSESEVNKKLTFLKEKLETYAQNNNLTINLTYGYTNFPPKELNGVISSGGSYKTILVTIGEGKGSNYWSILYPEYFNITFEDINSGEVEVRFFLKDLFS